LDTTSAEFAVLMLLSLEFNVPSEFGTTEKWMTWVSAVKSMLDAGIEACSHPG
jgi:hypothetical protein